MIEQGAAMFDTLVIGVGHNPDKGAGGMFSPDERVEMIAQTINEADIDNVIGIEVFSGYLGDFAREQEAGYILRGVRNSPDFEYERVMRNLNGDMYPELQTVFMVPPRELAEVSSSVVKGLIGPKGWQRVVVPMVPPAVFTRLLADNG